MRPTMTVALVALLLTSSAKGLQSPSTLYRRAIEASSSCTLNLFRQKNGPLFAWTTRPPNLTEQSNHTSSSMMSAEDPSRQTGVDVVPPPLLQQEQQSEGEEFLGASPSSRQPSRDTFQSDVSASSSTLPVAVLLNMNARGVTQATVDVARHVFGDAAVFVTTTATEADAAANAIVQCNPKIVVPMGGDGTLTAVLQSMCRAILSNDSESSSSSRNADSLDMTATCSLASAVRRLPIVGYIPLGTGNAVGSVVGCQTSQSKWWPWRRKLGRKSQLQNVLEQIKDLSQVDSTSQWNVVELPILEVTTRSTQPSGQPATNKALCFFAGVGFDSLMLNDFKEIKAWSVRTGILTSMLSSVTGYCVALVVKTLPQTVTKSNHKVRVRVSTRNPDETLWVDHRRGDFVQRVKSSVGSIAAKDKSSGTADPTPSTVLFEGETGILAAGTAPYYGGGLRLFPFARMTLDKMHLRLGRIHPATGFLRIPAIFAGSYRDKSDRFGVLDYIGDDFDVQILPKDGKSASDVGFPFQHSGESIGNVDSFRLQVVDEPVRFLSLLKDR